MMSTPLDDLSAAGVSVWLDDLSRTRLTSGGLAGLIADRHVVGVTTNPTIFAGALASGDAYAHQLTRLKEAGVGVEEAIKDLTTSDVRDACDLFAPIFEATDGEDGRVSIEVEPGLATDTAGTIAQARELYDLVGRENLLVKIPATREGLPAITATIASGINVNVTLIFSRERYREVVEAYLKGLEQAVGDGLDLSRIHSVASLFVSRVDTEVDRRLTELGGASELKGLAGIANATLAYRDYTELFGSARFDALRELGAREQRPLWASTGVKSDAYPDTLYVSQLVAPNTVNTMPEKTLQAFADHGFVGTPVTDHYASAEATLHELAGVGIDLDDVFATLEREGVEKFVTSWAELVATVTSELNGA
jgi:transaldolase